MENLVDGSDVNLRMLERVSILRDVVAVVELCPGQPLADEQLLDYANRVHRAASCKPGHITLPAISLEWRSRRRQRAAPGSVRGACFARETAASAPARHLCALHLGT
jgi:hypothetical protein